MYLFLRKYDNHPKHYCEKKSALQNSPNSMEVHLEQFQITSDTLKILQIETWQNQHLHVINNLKYGLFVLIGPAPIQHLNKRQCAGLFILCCFNNSSAYPEKLLDRLGFHPLLTFSLKNPLINLQFNRIHHRRTKGSSASLARVMGLQT